MGLFMTLQFLAFGPVAPALRSVSGQLGNAWPGTDYGARSCLEEMNGGGGGVWGDGGRGGGGMEKKEAGGGGGEEMC